MAVPFSNAARQVRRNVSSCDRCTWSPDCDGEVHLIIVVAGSFVMFKGFLHRVWGDRSTNSLSV